MKVLLTGYQGYVGSVMSGYLKSRGHSVIGLDTGYFNGLDLWTPPSVDEVRTVDMRNVQEKDVEGVEAIIHLAALSNDPLGDFAPELTDDINFKATKKLAEIAKKHGIKRFVFASSCSLYGAADVSKPVDETSPTLPLTPYAKSKIDCENALLAMKDEDFEPVFMRNATCYGDSPRIRIDVVLNNLTARAIVSGEVKLLSDGSAWRPLMHVEDMSASFEAVLTAPANLVSGEAFNVGTNEQNYQVIDIAKTVQKVVPGCDLTYSDDAQVDARSYRVSFDKLHSVLPNIGFKWNAEKGAAQIAERLKAEKAKAEDLFGRKHIRLEQLKYLVENQKVNADLFWNA
ncbi:MAG: NAD-dependent dehydratase [Thalassospira sp.]|jgi:nucleoside-diphosphate-sugar epimerase|uniref:NAD-dependent epimerase/dehydratase family protein n=1 Tax=Thalassospira sp. UBA4513 TaxID=1947675 RepID=UPI000C666822|nr:SDR family oxidoreductase [Thalassospira sp. UBA4513]MBE69366.1 NAD-dependent dehydratase [Thalassospira sp.]|tara:strand:+ start:1272 stop:2300 length:1029 start_codon:yes stop_codon:yes gene_type:complete